MPRGTLCPVPHLSGDIRLQNQWLAESVLCALLPHLKCHVSKTELGIFDLLPATCCGFSHPVPMDSTTIRPGPSAEISRSFPTPAYLHVRAVTQSYRDQLPKPCAIAGPPHLPAVASVLASSVPRKPRWRLPVVCRLHNGPREIFLS